MGNTIGVFFSGITPILIGCSFAYIVNIFMCSFEKRYFPNSKKAIVIKSRRPVCMTGAILMVLGVIVLLIYMIIPELVNCIETFLMHCRIWQPMFLKMNMYKWWYLLSHWKNYEP